MSRTGVNGRPGGGVYLPRLPRPAKSDQEQQRLAGTLTLQWKPGDNTDLSLDGLYSRFKVDRLDTYFDARSFGRAISNNGQPLTSVREIEVDDNGSLIHGLFDGVDLRSEMQQEKFTSTYRQVNLNLDHRFSDTVRVYGLAGINQSRLDVDRLQVAIDANDTRDFSIDFRDNPDIPKIGYGIDTTNPALFRYGPPLTNGDQQGQLSNFIRRNVILSKTFELNGEWQAAQGFTFVAGGQYRTNRYTARERQLGTTTPLTWKRSGKARAMRIPRRASARTSTGSCRISSRLIRPSSATRSGSTITLIAASNARAAPTAASMRNTSRAI